jgi:ribokinase
MIGSVGRDELGQFARGALSDHGVRQRVSCAEESPTGMAFIDVVPPGDNIIRLVEGANGALSASEIERSSDIVAAAKVLLLQNEIPLEASLSAAQIARRSGATVIMDPAPAPVIPWRDDVLSHFDILTPNATEAGQFLGATPQSLDEGEEAARALSARHGLGVIVTLGALGVAWAIGGRSGKRPACPAQAVDTVAAGDCFNGAIAAELWRGADLEAALPFALRAAALSTTRAGAAASLPTLAETRAFDSA